MQEVLAAMRVGTRIVDRGLREEVQLAALDGRDVDVYTLGAGFDARWFRLASTLAHTTVYEVERSSVLELKQAVFDDSDYAEAWARVQAVPRADADWDIESRPGRRAIVVLEGAWARLGHRGLLGLLERLAQEHEDVRVLVDVPRTAEGFSASALRGLGWWLAEVVDMVSRRQLMAQSGHPHLPGDRSPAGAATPSSAQRIAPPTTVPTGS